MSYFAKRDSRPKNITTYKKSLTLNASGQNPSSSHHILQLQRTLGNHATQTLLNQSVIQRDESEEENENPINSFKRRLDYIENELIPALKTAFKGNDQETALNVMGQLVRNPLLVYSGSIAKFISINLRGIGSGKFELMGIYNRFHSLGSDLKKLVDKYNSKPAVYPATSLYYEKRQQAQESEREQKQMDKSNRKQGGDRNRHPERHQVTERPSRFRNT